MGGSGYYRRNEDGPWYPWLMHLSVDGELVSLSLRDSTASLRAAANKIHE